MRSDDKASIGARQHECTMADISICQPGVLSLLLAIKDKKSGGPDNIPNTFLKRYAEWVSKYLTLIFQASLSQNAVPFDCHCAKVMAVLTAGNKSSSINYRLISLTSTCCKIMEHMVSKSLYYYLENSNLLYKTSMVFDENFPVTQLRECVDDFCKSVNKGDRQT